MLKKLAVPLFTLAITTFGCSSSTTPTGTGGTSGGTGGGSATGGTTGATGGAGGAQATGGAGGAASATGGAGGVHATGGAGGAVTTTDAGRMADCTVTDSAGTDTLTPTIFCAQMAAYCPTQFATFTNEAACESTYTSSGQEHCRSYHMCWGVEGITNTSGAVPATHCPHTIGMGLCQATTDAASGN